MTATVKKVCIVGISLDHGGAERSMAILSGMLRDKGHEVHLVILNDKIHQDFTGILFNLGVFKPNKDTLFTRLFRFIKLRRYLLKNEFDFIIDHRPKNNYYRELFYHKYVYRTMKKIYVVHSSKQQQDFDNSKGKLYKVFKNNFATVTVSKHIEKSIFNQNGITNTTTIYNAYNPLWQQADHVKPQELPNENYILFYGRLEDEVKDVTFLIHSFLESELWQKNIYLVILGNGSDEEKLKQLASSIGCVNHILFYPFTPNPFPFVKNAKFVTLTSRYEGFPMVLVESLSLGVPIVALDIISGPSEIIHHETNGLLIQERSTSSFAKAMVRMFEDDTLYQNCKESAQISVSQFSEKIIAERWHQLLTS